MRQEIEATLELVRRWHSKDEHYGFFDSVALSTQTPLKLFEELAYWNYVGWHMQEQFPATALESMRVNRNRCEVMDRIDEWHHRVCGTVILPDTAANTESFGSIVDRIVNHQIKSLHVGDLDKPPGNMDEFRRLSILDGQLDDLIDAAVQLDEDCRSGRRYCLGYSRFKVNLPKEER